VYKVRRERGQEKSLQPFRSATAKLKLKELELINDNTTHVFTFPLADKKTVLNTIFKYGIKSYIESKGKKQIELYCYIEQPAYETLQEDREACKIAFEQFLIEYEEIVSACYSGDKDGIIIRDIFTLKGAIPQDYSIVAGVVRERSIVEL
jgi:hypothetical protein